VPATRANRNGEDEHRAGEAGDLPVTRLPASSCAKELLRGGVHVKYDRID